MGEVYAQWTDVGGVEWRIHRLDDHLNIDVRPPSGEEWWIHASLTLPGWGDDDD